MGACLCYQEILCFLRCLPRATTAKKREREVGYKYLQCNQTAAEILFSISKQGNTKEKSDTLYLTIFFRFRYLALWLIFFPSQLYTIFKNTETKTKCGETQSQAARVAREDEEDKKKSKTVVRKAFS